MKDKELKRRVEACCADYDAVTGKSFDHFFCPILMRDEETELCRGHIINHAFSTCNVWLPQRKDIDNFYGSVVEADLISVVDDRDKDPVQVLLDEKLRRKHRPKLEFEGESLGFYFPRSEDVPSEHTLVRVENQDGQAICNVAMKVSEHKMFETAGKDIQIVIERDYRPAVIASMLKAAHLTLFRMLGYQHVFSPTGRYVAHVLSEFFDKYKTPRNVRRTDVDSYFIQHETMISPIIVPDGEVLRGTVEDNRFISCFSTRNEVFAIGVIIKAGRDMFCVFLPTDCGQSINTYFSFLKEPPQAVSARVTQFNPERDGGVWEIPPGEPMLLPLRQDFPLPTG